MSSSGTDAVPRPSVSPISRTHIWLLVGVTASMVVVLFIMRYCCNILIIDVCILGDCSALKKIICFWKYRRNDDDTNNGGGETTMTNGNDEEEQRRRGGGGEADNNSPSVLYSQLSAMQKDKIFPILATLIFTSSNDTIPQKLNSSMDEKKEESIMNQLEENNSTTAAEQNCSICMEDFDTDKCVTTKVCSHKYNFECIQNWLQKSIMCPNCRAQLISDTDLQRLIDQT